ncbi:ABC-type transport system involved in multi-copper enzyme maturation permease subunit [Streptosporangium lutulentum]|uniref:ABC-type transport system involved in multi-copper enzyme maturation permease subunit n=1 Tax=Streptosporangium lutulentum TaxID=1461250 RepID=A0ABT9Q5E8_9ACTN|nr:ABC transporter permease [Streptosporangium lutulentum]MDP9841961.1 ABC-type transport system involved in multi-copper enzyme maturation permease subunit [Streptosporangium lutulentum]
MPAATRAELTKLLTLPSVWIVTGVILALHTLVQLQSAELFADAVANITPDGIIEIFTGQPQPAKQEILGLLAGASLQMGLFLPVLAAVIAGQEFRSRQLGLTVLAMPRRARMVTAKLLATALYVLVVAILIVGVSTAFVYAAIRDWNAGLLLTEEAFLGYGRFIAFAVLFCLTAFAVTVVARGTLTGIVVTVALIAVTMSQVLAGAAPDLDALFPLSAARNLILDPGIGDLTAGREHGLLVLIGWAVATAVAAAITLSRRDAR